MTKQMNSLNEAHAANQENVHAYMVRNNGFQVISGDFWIKHLGNRNYQVAVITRPEYGIQKGWVDFVDMDLNDYDEETIAKAWDDAGDFEYATEIITKDQMTAKLLVQHAYADIDEQTPFEGDEQLQSIMKKYGIVDDLEV